MKKFKTNPLNFQRCQQFLDLFSQKKGNISNQQVRKFIAKSQRNTLRLQVYFQPFQKIMLNLTKQLIQDQFIATNSLLLSNTTAMFGYLNLYSKQWMFHCGKIMHKWMKIGQKIELQEMDKIYRSFVELNQNNQLQFLDMIRTEIIKHISRLIKDMNQQNNFTDEIDFFKKMELFHKYIRTILLDGHSNLAQLSIIFVQFQRILQKRQQKIPLKLVNQYDFPHSACSYELYLVLKLQNLGQYYSKYLQKTFEKYKSRNALKNIKPKQKYERKGESVFEMRFQRNLNQNGYWYDQNIQIGLHQYDILLKGLLRSEYLPFKDINLADLKNGLFQPISQLQLKSYQRMSGIWNIQQKQQFKEKILINLNGPYHYITGDKVDLVRSQKIRENIVQHYGYPKFTTINYKEWQRNTTNQKEIREYLHNLTVL